ncbi:MAG: hypothetical protein ACYTGV_12550 [Planctomycetota bacterium]|jgi:hypothetical protein
MSSHHNTRFPKSALKRYADLILRHVYQNGGRERYVSVQEMEDTLGLEQELILDLCRTRLLGEVQIADRLPDELEDGVECRTPIERQLVRDWFSQPHVRIRPAQVRLTADELLRERKKRKKSRRRGKSRS